MADKQYNAMLEVGHTAHRHKIPGPMAHTMIDIAQNSLELWRRDDKTAVRFAAGVLIGPTNLLLLRNTTGQLPEPVVSAFFRLIGLLEYLADLDGGRYEAICSPCGHSLQPQRILEGTGGHQKSLGCSQGAGRGLAQEAGYLADVSACSTAHITAKM